MSKATLLLAAVMLAGCSHEESSQTRDDARKLGEDLKHDAQSANAVVTKEMKDARTKVQQETEKAKRDLNKPNQ